MNFEENLISIEYFQKDETILQENCKEIIKVIEKETKKVFTAIIFKIDSEINIEHILKDFYGQNNYQNLKLHSLIQFIGYNYYDFNYKFNPTIITEFTRYISLNQITTNKVSKKDINFNYTKKIINIFGIAFGINYLHQNKIFPRDLTTKIILLDNNLYPKISGYYIPYNLKNNAEETPDDLTEDSQIKADIYSFGIIVEEIIRENLPKKDASLNSYFKLIDNCKSDDLSKRPSFDQIISDLKNNRGFIIKDIDVEEYKEYIKLIENNNYKIDYLIEDKKKS